MMGRNIMGAEATNTGAAGAAGAEAAVDEELENLDERPPEGNKPPAPEDEAGQGDPEDQTDQEDGQFKDGELAELGAKAQEKVNARIHELNVKRKDAEKRAADLEAQYGGLEKKLGDAFVQAAARIGIAPEYIEPEEAKMLDRFEKLRSWKRWCASNRAGYEGSGGNDRSMTAEEVAAREAAIDDELLDISGPARALYMERTKQMREDMALGRKLRLQGKGKPAGGQKRVPQPPKLPQGAGGGRRPPVSAARKERPTFSADEFEKDGADEGALEKQYEKLFGGGS
jgi:hypothetical protein